MIRSSSLQGLNVSLLELTAIHVWLPLNGNTYTGQRDPRVRQNDYMSGMMNLGYRY